MLNLLILLTFHVCLVSLCHAQDTELNRTTVTGGSIVVKLTNLHEEVLEVVWVQPYITINPHIFFILSHMVSLFLCIRLINTLLLLQLKLNSTERSTWVSQTHSLFFHFFFSLSCVCFSH